jgi:hypothetical protein
MEEKVQKSIEDVTEMIAGSVLAQAVAGLAIATIKQLVVTDVEKSDVTGKKELHPTEDETSVSKVDTEATQTTGSVSEDKVAGMNGEVQADDTQADVLTTDAKATNTGASAVEPKAGALKTEVRGLFIS